MDSNDFFYNNKKSKLPVPFLPENLKTTREKAEWIVNYSDFGFIELDLNIDLEQWKKELQLCNSYFVPHRSEDSNGWSSCCIHGIDIDKTGTWSNYGYNSEDEVEYKWTSLAEKIPKIKKFLNQFPYDEFKRIRFMKLDPGGYIEPHSDAPGKLPGELGLNVIELGIPINIAITHPKDCYFSLENFGTVPFEEGKAFIVNIRNYHSVVNYSNRSRVHLIMQGIPTERYDKFSELLVKSYEKTYAKYC